MNAKFVLLTAAMVVANSVLPWANAQEKNVSYKTSYAKSITKSQAKAAKMFQVVENFEKIDANNDGVVTRKELREYALSTRRHVPMT